MTAVDTIGMAPAGNTQPGSSPNDNRQESLDGPRPGSRADRMTQPLARDVLKALAEHHGVCVRPIALRRTDKLTGETSVIDVPCGARLSAKCKPCAEKARKLRQQQIREGWHLTDEPLPPVEDADDETKALISLRCTFAFDRAEAERSCEWEQVAELDAAIDEVDRDLSTRRVRGVLDVPADAKDKTPRRVRSTKRRTDAVQLPRLPVEDRTVGRTYAAKDGRTFTPSTLLTITLDTYGPVHTGSRTRRGHLQPCGCGKLHADADPILGTPVDPATYDYRRAALDAVFFAAGLDRFWQNLRRAAGWNVQYAGAVEMQRRLAPHVHYAMRGTLPKALLRQVAAGTYHQVWWPQFSEPVHTVAKPPVWDDATSAYLDPTTGTPLKTWAQALDELTDPAATPAYVMRLGRVDARGINHGSKDAERSIRYVTKYITKDLTEQAAADSAAQKAHLGRLHEELSTLPCAPTCANWLLYGVQPDKAKPGLTPGRCSGKVHQRSTLGFTGRRVLISRQWSGKTLADHRADNRSWIRTILAGALADDEHPAVSIDTDRFSYEPARHNEPDVPSLHLRIMHAIAVRERWRAEVLAAREVPPDPVPAEQDPAYALAA